MCPVELPLARAMEKFSPVQRSNDPIAVVRFIAGEELLSALSMALFQVCVAK